LLRAAEQIIRNSNKVIIQVRAVKIQLLFVTPNPQVGHLIKALKPVIMPIQTKANLHALGEKAESREPRNKEYPQGFQLINLRIWGYCSAGQEGKSIY
jgi:hypothetical protein